MVPALLYMHSDIMVLKPWFFSHLSSHEEMGNLNDEVERPYKVLLVAMITFNDGTGLAQHLPSLLVAVMSQQKLKIIKNVLLMH